MSTFGAISFVVPLMLVGGLLAAGPVLAHLLHRRTRRQIIFPSIELLSDSVAHQSYFFRLRRLLLLLVRLGVILAIVVGFSQPLWRTDSPVATGPEGPVAVVFLVDVSASTHQTAGGVPVAMMLRDSAARAVDQLLIGADVANVVYLSAHPHAAFGSLTANLAAVRHEINSLTPTAERGDIVGAMALAARLLATHDGPGHLVILTDLQKTNFADLGVPGRVPDLGPRTVVTIVPISEMELSNVAIFDPRVNPSIPLVGEPAHLTAHLANFGPTDHEVDVRLTLNDHLVDTRRVWLDAWQQHQISFDLALKSLGEHRIVLSVPPDALELDNQCCLLTQAQDQISVVVISDQAPDRPGTSAYFLLRALAPRSGVKDRFRAQYLRSSDVGWSHLREVPVVFIGNVQRLGPELLAALHRLMVRGGTVVFFCEGPTVLENLVALDGLSPGGVLAFEPQALQDFSLRGELLQITDGDWQGPLLREFDESSRRAIQRIGFRQIWTTGPLHAEAKELLRFADGTLALAERHVGNGRLLLANFGVTASASDLGKYGGFVALTQSLASSLAPVEAMWSGGTVGWPLHFGVSEGYDPTRPGFEVLGPNGTVIDGTAFHLVLDELAISLERPPLPGFYMARQGDEVLALAAVNVDSRESDLRRVDGQALRAMLLSAVDDVAMCTTPSIDGWLTSRGVALWGWAILVAMLLLVIEIGLLGYWRR